MKWIRQVIAALVDKAMFKLWFWNIDRQMRKAKKKLRLSKVTKDRLSK